MHPVIIIGTVRSLWTDAMGQIPRSTKRIFSYVYDRVFGVVKFKFAIWIFQGAKGVAMANKFKQKSAKIALLSVLCKKSRTFSCK